MITDQQRDGQRSPLQDLETLYIGGAELAVVRRACVGYATGPNQFMRDCEGKLTTTMTRIILGSGQGNKHEVER
jgi:hypothetical protein